MSYTIKEFAEKIGVTVSTLRYYEKAGISIKDIKKYMDLCQEGDNTLNERMEIFLQRKEIVQKQIEELNNIMKTIDYKLWYYEESIKAGTEDIHKKDKDNNKQIV